ncbi:ABC transporter ATP-binding protein [Vagococcus carniphilus]|uniref:ABC transporter ATP-binding protein n=1 Tax=Vagococcus carniphilus TaxID=218144 RepID=UPI003BAC9020
MKTIVQTKNLSKSFKTYQAVNQLNLEIKEGEIYGFLGPNGAGKSTTIRMILGLIKPSSGSVFVFNKDLATERVNILKEVGALVENPSYYPHLTAKENLEVIRTILKVPVSRIDDVLETVKLSHVANKKVKEFSLGMKQRLGIAQAILHQPKLLILDEPTNGLDPEGIIEMRLLLKELAKNGTTIIVSSHLLSEIEHIATTVAIINKGNLLYQGKMTELKEIFQPKIRLRLNNPSLALTIIEGEIINDDLIIEQQTDESMAILVKQLIEMSIKIYRIEDMEQSLEDTFLSMIERDTNGTIN